MSTVLMRGVLSVLLLSSALGFPAQYILEVIPHCGDGLSDGKIEIVSDLTVSPSARCGNGLVGFNEVLDDAHCFLDVGFNINSSAPCKLTKRLGASVYLATVYVGWGESGSPIISNEEQFLVSCSFGENGIQGSVDKTGIDGLVAPPELKFNIGPNATSSIKLEIVDVLGNTVQDNLPVGKKVQLQAISDGTDGTVGLHPSSCDVVGVTSNVRYAILRAGCGDGIIFHKNAGFTSAKLRAYSPYFSTFHILRDYNIKFECNFTVCTSNCDGNSCRTARDTRYRQGQDDGSINNVQSDEYTIILTDPDTSREVKEEITRGQSLTGDPDTSSLSQQNLSWRVMLLFSVFTMLCVLSLSLSLYSFVLVNRMQLSQC